MKEIILYAHGGSANHGCEAIVRTTISILDNKRITVYSHNKESDMLYSLNEISSIRQTYNLYKFSPKGLYSGVMRKYLKNWKPEARFMYKELLKERDKTVLSIGGDNYCYGFPGRLIYVNKELSKRNKTVLWGCSITPKRLEDHRVVEDMRLYSLIIVRESITYDALVKAGIMENTKLYPDPAFTLEKIELKLPDGFKEDKTIGINISPLIMKLDKGKQITYKNYYNLIHYIIKNTDFNIALIPHVVIKRNNDLEVLTELYNEFKYTNRVFLIKDHNSMELKGFISRCRMFIAARTHASIAAYSSCVPTVVVGYSVKAKGIAKDIFGKYDNYVIPVQSLMSENDLISAFKWLNDHENEIRIHLKNFMPSYIKRAWQAGDEVKKIAGDSIYGFSK